MLVCDLRHMRGVVSVSASQQKHQIHSTGSGSSRRTDRAEERGAGCLRNSTRARRSSRCAETDGVLQNRLHPRSRTTTIIVIIVIALMYGGTPLLSDSALAVLLNLFANMGGDGWVAEVG